MRNEFFVIADRLINKMIMMKESYIKKKGYKCLIVKNKELLCF